MLRNQLSKGTNGLVKTKYLTFGIEADGIRTAKPRLERIENDILNNFKLAPSGFEFKHGRMFRMGKKHGAVSFVQILAPELNDRMLADFLEMESSLIVSLHVRSIDQMNAINKRRSVHKRVAFSLKKIRT